MKMTRSLPINVLALSVMLGSNLAGASDFGPDQASLDEKRHQREAAGVLGGAALGGVLAGPPGAIAFAILGGVLSDSHSSRREKEATEDSLQRLGERYTALETENSDLQLAFADLERSVLVSNEMASQKAACCFDTELVLHFKTNSSDVEPHYQAELQHFASLVKANPEAMVQLTGYADQRGASDVNLTLSRERLGAVENLLQQMGLPADALQSTAFGETRPLNNDDNPEGLFFDRRVVLKATAPGNAMLSQIPD